MSTGDNRHLSDLLENKRYTSHSNVSRIEAKYTQNHYNTKKKDDDNEEIMELIRQRLELGRERYSRASGELKTMTGNLWL